ncbi:glutamine-hydrolyzing GMP synthase [Chlamydiota bacterium]
MILIIDFGSQYNQLIARKIRELNVYCEIEPPSISIERIKEINPRGIILSGGPASIYHPESPKCDPGIFNLGIPILGICYGMQFMVHELGGKVQKADKREYGFAHLSITDHSTLFSELKDPEAQVWMSHGDSLSLLPDGFISLASTENTPYAAIACKIKNFFGVQFHPEVSHTPKGIKILSYFSLNVCNCSQDWNMKNFIEKTVEEIKTLVGNKKVVLGLSGGVDSSVTAILLHQAIGNNLHCIFVDNGLLRKNEVDRVQSLFSKHFNINLTVSYSQDRFLSKLANITDPEKKRKIIGNEFIKVFEEESKKLGTIKFLAQGTLYPDLIESQSAFGGPSAVIKTHHNVGGLPEKMQLTLIEPLKHLFKDEVRALGQELGMPHEVIWRQPFPGPGLAVRILGEVTKVRTDILKEADYIVIDEIKQAGYYYKLWQSFAVLLPIQTVGIMGDERTYENVIAVRAVTSDDAMTADWAKLPYELLSRISNRIINEVRGVNRVVYDISSKPPSTIEWE